MHQHARAERLALSETLRRVGPDSRTLCGEWTSHQLAAHLVLRERSVVELAGRIPVPAVQRRAAAVVDELAATAPFASLVDTFERGPRWSEVLGPVPVAWLWALPPVREFANLLEYFVHHEDVRRAQPSWNARTLPVAVQAAVWQRLRLLAQVTLRAVPVGVELQWPSHGSIRTRSARRSSGAAVRVVGDPVEVALFAFGRLAVAGVAYEGDDADIAAVQGADISL
jgi:uncharacterized protein (TIGR03085 family)